MITEEQIDVAKDELIKARQRVADIKQAYAEQECPLKVGDIVRCCGCSHQGKRMIVDKILAPKYGGIIDGAWRVVGRVLKADGSEGKNYTDFAQKQYERSKA